MAILNFKGKPFVQNYHLQVKYHQLIPRKSKSLTKKVSLHDNLIIHGDNLKALKALLPTYAGKIKCIYIDPPYNTGNEKWVYNDNVNSLMMQEWLGKVVDKEDLTRHDKWLCMMMPRLKVLYELLSNEGIIFVSIDDTEVHHLRMLMDEVFGPDNFLAHLTWRGMHTVRSSSKDFNQNTEFVLSYARDKKMLIVEGNPKTYLRYPADKEVDYRYDDDDGNGLYKLDPLHSRNYYTPYKYTFKNGQEWKAPKGTYPRYSPDTLKEFEKSGRIVLTGDKLRRKDGRTREYKGKNPVAKRYLKEVQEGVPPDTLLPTEIVGFSKDGTAEMMEIFGDKVFDQPKPSSLIKFLLRIRRKVDNTECLILDSFAGTATTAHAALALNKEDDENRRFILVECEDYADKITAERVRRVIKGVKGAKDENLKKGFGGTFSYFELGDPIEMESILSGDNLPSYKELARYVFYTATGEEFDEKQLDEKRNFIGESREYLIYLFYKPDIDYLKATALTLDKAQALGPYKNKKRLVFAPTKYLDQDHLDQLRIDFAQLPFEIYKLVK
jgi:adenine-specific DNA-methyltransferase